MSVFKKNNNSLIPDLVKVYSDRPDSIPKLYSSKGSPGEISLGKISRSIGIDPELAGELKKQFGPDTVAVIFAHERGHDELHR
ncbi:MAG: hypothetical protein J6W00_05390 [Lentisphaeria bacterium]|nr:hypothetical protein [Lentisphaeria bacterium]